MYDLETDYAQEHPISDAALEERCIEGLRRCMEQCQAPAEQYERLGL